MGLIAMSERDLQRIEVLSKVVERRMTIVAAARMLALSPRQVRRLLETTLFARSSLIVLTPPMDASLKW
jgi:hypothetical protein